MMNLLKTKKVITLIILGLIATIFSLIYYFSFNNPNNILLIIICIIDFVLFFLNSLIIALCFDKSKILTIIITIGIMIGLVLLFEFIVLAATFNSEKLVFSLDLFYKVLLVALFVSPSLIVLMPVLYIVCESLAC